MKSASNIRSKLPSALNFRSSTGLLALASLGIALGLQPVHAQSELHLNAGAASPDASSQLIWANGSAFGTNSGYTQGMTLTSSGPRAGFYVSGSPVMTALPTTPENGGPAPFAAAQGSFINVRLFLLDAPAGGTFGFWEPGSTKPTYSLGVGSASPLIALSDETLGAGNLGADPYGHIENRFFTATAAGNYLLGLQLISSDDHGPGANPIHTPSDMLVIRFVASAVPEPGCVVLLSSGLILAAGMVFLRKKGDRPHPDSAEEFGQAPADLKSPRGNAVKIALLSVLLPCCFGAAMAAETQSSSPSPVAASAPTSFAALKEPPPLSKEILELVETNRAGTVWERVYAITNAPITKTEKAQALLLVQKTLPREDQRRLTHTIVSNVDDVAYLVIRKQLMDTRLNSQILSVYMTDTLKRKNWIKLPMILDIARDSSHPMSAEACELLRAYLQADHGTNWAQWGETMNAWLKKNPV